MAVLSQVQPGPQGSDSETKTNTHCHSDNAEPHVQVVEELLMQ